MLTTEEKARIRAEEIFRREVRRDLEAGKPRPTRRKRAWEILNSSFALWFLSSVILASFTTAFTSYMSWQGKRDDRADLENRLDLEIGNRIAQALAGVRIDTLRLEHGQIFSPDAYYINAGRYLNNTFLFDPGNRQDFSLYPEFRTRGFRSLIFELQTVATDSEQPGLQQALDIHERLADLGSVYDGPAAEAACLQALKNAAGFLEDLRRLRWSLIFDENPSLADATAR